ncbi:MAG: hypothetical protein QG641_2344 [Candidatus Poribacteria bacterium]|nr:hypothetical protein [Candidatus Poribacteria bacterium]
MFFDPHKMILSDLQRLTSEQTEAIHNLVKLGLIESEKLEILVNEMAKDRFAKGKAYIEFASKLDINSPEDQPHIISRNYYGMYHLVRAVIFHTLRKDINNHDALPEVFSRSIKIEKSIVSFVGEKLDNWRDKRNDIDYSPYLPDDIAIICEESIRDAKEIFIICKKYLQERGVDLESY